MLSPNANEHCGGIDQMQFRFLAPPSVRCDQHLASQPIYGQNSLESFGKFAMTTIHIPDETAEQLRQAAEAEGRTVDEMATEGLAAFLASRAKLEALRAAIDEGDASGAFEGDAFASVRAELGLPPR
jgi:predicted transcriptional regulator